MILKKWLIKVFFEDHSFLEFSIKKEFKEEAIINAVNNTKIRYPEKKIISTICKPS